MGRTPLLHRILAIMDFSHHKKTATSLQLVSVARRKCLLHNNVRIDSFPLQGQVHPSDFMS